MQTGSGPKPKPECCLTHKTKLAAYTHYSKSFDGSCELSHLVLKILNILKACKNDLKHHYKDNLAPKIYFLWLDEPQNDILTTF